jgi:hypothetical protein
MRTTRWLAIFFVCATWLAPARAAAPAAPPDATGAWKWTIQTPDGDSIDMSVQLKQSGEQLTGVFLDGFDQQKFDIRNGHVKDGKISFTVTRPFNDQTITVNYKGDLSTDAIKGTLEVKFGDQDPNTSPWEAKRLKADASATQPSTQLSTQP